MNDASAVPNHNGNNGFSHMNDPNNMAAAPIPGGGMMDPSAFMTNPNQFNPAVAAGQFANPQQMAAAMQNGPMRNASPSFSNPVYQTNSVIPSKRPRPREDSIGASPRQNPNMLPTSRAGTPQQSHFPGFQPNAMQQQNPGQPQHYPHLQPNGSANASPSPVMAGNQLRPGSVPGRVNTASPHPFSPASQQFNHQPSPVPSEHSGTPQPNPYMQQQMQQQNYPPNFNPGYAPSPSPGRPMPQNQMPQFMAAQQMGQQPQPRPQMHPNQMLTPQQMHQMQQMQQQMQAQGRGGVDQSNLMYQQFLQQKFHQGNMAAMGNMGNMANIQMAQMQAQNMAQQGRGIMQKQGVPMQNGQIPPGAMRPHQPPQVPRATNPDAFLKNLVAFMHAKQLPFDPNPIIEGRPLHLLQIFQTVCKFGYYQKATATNSWHQIAVTLGLNPQQIPTAPGQIKAIYERSLLKFEEAWMTQQMTQQMKQQGMPVPPGQGKPQRMGQIQPGHPMQPGQPPQMQQHHTQTPVKQMTHGIQHPTANGFSTPQHPQMAQPPTHATPGPGHARSSMSKSIDSTPGTGDFPIASPGPTGKPGSVSMQPPPHQQGEATQANAAAALPFPGPFSSDPDEYVPCSREVDKHTFGGLDLPSLMKLGTELERCKPDIPHATELGIIDLHALTKSIQSGIHGEVRLALDTLATVTKAADALAPLTIDLRHCDDLIESLLDCAEEQVDLLADKADPISDEIDLTSYEDVARLCRAEITLSVRKVSIFGDVDYELEHAAQRLLAITTILRNLSFADVNQPVIADESVVKFLCGVIRSLGTHENLLQTSSNCLDFMKDVVILLSNIAGSLELPGREQALCLLQFLLSFAPTPAPALTNGRVVFSPYEPALHPYLPYAVDSLAKLLARDEPNRTHFKAIFAADASTSWPYELLTRTFALAISPIPDQTKESRPASLPSVVEARKPMLMQGLLAADIIAQLAPSPETGVTRCWLSSGEGFAHNLFRLIRTLCSQAESAPRPGPNPRTQPRDDSDVLYIITCGVSTLRRLGEKARDPNDPSPHPFPTLPIRESLFGALQTLKSPKWALILNQLSALSGLED